MDDLDRAQILEEQGREAALAHAMIRTPPGRQIIVNGVVRCEDCGTPVPAGRLAAHPHATRCTECQGVRELR